MTALSAPSADPSSSDETTDLSDPAARSIVTCLIGVFDPNVNDDVLIQIPYSGSVITPEEIVDESWLENAGLGDIGTGVSELALEVELAPDPPATDPPAADPPNIAAEIAPPSTPPVAEPIVLDVAPIEAAVSEAVNAGARESGPEGIHAELGAAAVERITHVRAETPVHDEISVLREPAPLHIKQAVLEPTPQPVSPSRAKKIVATTPAPPPAAHAWTTHASYSDRFDPSLPEGRRGAPPPVDWRKELKLRRRPVRERTSEYRTDDFAFFARAFKVFAVVTFAIALLALAMRFARALGLSPDALAVLKMLAHVAIGGGAVMLYRSDDSSER